MINQMCCKPRFLKLALLLAATTNRLMIPIGQCRGSLRLTYSLGFAVFLAGCASEPALEDQNPVQGGDAASSQEVAGEESEPEAGSFGAVYSEKRQKSDAR